MKSNTRRKDRKGNSNKESESSSISKSAPKVVLLRNVNPTSSKSEAAAKPEPESIAGKKASDNVKMVEISKSNAGPIPTATGSRQEAAKEAPVVSQKLVLSAEYLLKDIDYSPVPLCNLINSDTWSFDSKHVSKHLMPAESSAVAAVPGVKQGPAFSVLGAIGKQSVGKSTLLNQLAGDEVFETHATCTDKTLLQHVTNGVNLCCTSDRLWLLDTQPVQSIAMLDKLVLQSNTPANLPNWDALSLIQLTSLQLTAFMMATCDLLLIVTDWAIDSNLIKLICTARMLAFNHNPIKCKLLFVLPHESSAANRTQSTSYIQSVFGDDAGVYQPNSRVDSNTFVEDMLRLVAKQKSNSTPTTEQAWLANAARYWESFVHKKSTLAKYVDFMRDASQLSPEVAQN